MPDIYFFSSWVLFLNILGLSKIFLTNLRVVFVFLCSTADFTLECSHGYHTVSFLFLNYEHWPQLCQGKVPSAFNGGLCSFVTFWMSRQWTVGAWRKAQYSMFSLCVDNCWDCCLLQSKNLRNSFVADYSMIYVMRCLSFFRSGHDLVFLKSSHHLHDVRQILLNYVWIYRQSSDLGVACEIKLKLCG